eukprot:6455700-Amphidinium_carterae.1
MDQGFLVLSRKPFAMERDCAKQEDFCLFSVNVFGTMSCKGLLPIMITEELKLLFIGDTNREIAFPNVPAASLQVLLQGRERSENHLQLAHMSLLKDTIHQPELSELLSLVV